MCFYVIDEPRLIKEYEYNLKRKGRGILNWFITPERVLYVLIDVYECKYAYIVPFSEASAIVRLMLDGNSSILGVVSEEQLFEVNTEKTKEPSLDYQDIEVF